MGLNIGTIKKITGEIANLSEDIQKFKSTVKDNTKELAKITGQIEKHEELRLKKIREEELKAYSESERFSLVENSPPALKEVKVDIDIPNILKKLDIL